MTKANFAPIAINKCQPNNIDNTASGLYRLHILKTEKISLKYLKRSFLVSILIIVAVISIPIVSLPGDDFFGIQLKFLKHALEWDYFVAVITFYLLTFFMWKKQI